MGGGGDAGEERQSAGDKQENKNIWEKGEKTDRRTNQAPLHRRSPGNHRHTFPTRQNDPNPTRNHISNHILVNPPDSPRRASQCPRGPEYALSHLICHPIVPSKNIVVVGHSSGP